MSKPGNRITAMQMRTTLRRIPTRHWCFSALICHSLRGSLTLLGVVSTKRMRDNQFVPIADESDQRKGGCARACQCSSFLKDTVRRTRLAQRWRKVWLKRSICAVSPVSFPTGRWRLDGSTASIGLPEVTRAYRAFAIVRRERFPQLATRFGGTITKGQTNNPARLAFQGNPYPDLLAFGADK